MDWNVAIVMFSWFLGAFVGGLCGLGGVLMAMPLMLLVLSMHDAILVSCLVALPLTGAMAFFYWRYCDFKTLGLLFAGIIPGGFVGVEILQIVPGNILQISLGILIIVFISAMRFCKQHLHLEQTVLRTIVTGFFGGLLGTSISVDGPVIGMYGLLVAWNPYLFLGISSLYYFCRSIVTCLLQWQNGLYSDLVWHYSLYTIPAGLFGFVLSIPIVRRIKTSAFRTIVKIILIIAGISCLWRAF